MHHEFSRATSPGAEPIELFAGAADLWAFVRRRKVWIAGGILLGIAAAVALHSALPETAEVHAKILVIKKDSNLPVEGAASSRDFEGNVVEDILSTHMEIIASPRIVGRA